MEKAQMMNTPDPYYQKYECKTWKPENSDTERNKWQRKLGISSFDPATQKEQEVQAQRNFLEAYVRPDEYQLGVKLHKKLCKWSTGDNWDNCELVNKVMAG
ncbi:hypothetical protein L6452_05700 [Arctium lappa]|uniref:Uncharacterized protein n=1 Tax=Arctium lappa TaxID=4217 RepID=A0ACB9EHT1_ARCLA|nr:hypothetical protein L6452_05700 [Arctium lappa]